MSAQQLPWNNVDAVPANELVEARVALHYATQAVSAQADAILPKAADDSQSNLGYDQQAPALVTHALPGDYHAGISLADAAWQVRKGNGTVLERQAFAGQSVRDGIHWFLETLRGLDVPYESMPAMRDYDMPEAAYLDAPLPDCSAHARAIDSWLRQADAVLQVVASETPGASAVRTWPHHFDIGTLITLDPDRDHESARSIGVGLSPGDGGYAEPYFYVNLWPSADKHERPKLPMGTWHEEGWFGGVLTGSEIQGASDQREAVDGFLRTAINANRAALEALG